MQPAQVDPLSYENLDDLPGDEPSIFSSPEKNDSLIKKNVFDSLVIEKIR